MIFLKNFGKEDSIFDSNKIQQVKCSLVTGMAKILIIQPFDFIRYRIQSSDYPVSIKKITLSLINKEGLKAFLLGVPATSCGVLISSLIHFTLYQHFQKIFIFREFDKDISDSLKNLEIFKLMELNHIKKFNENLRLDTDEIDFSDQNQDFIVKADFGNKYKNNGEIENGKGQQNIKKAYINNTQQSNDLDLMKKDINKNYLECTAKCYETHLTKILKICAISGFLSGIGLAILTAPIDNIRIRMQSVQNIEILEKATYRNSNTVNCVLNTYKNFGVRGFFLAFHIGILREGIASTLYFTSYEYLKNKEKIKNQTNNIQFYKSFIYGAIAGGINWLITFPIDTLKTKLISDSVIENKRLYKNSLDCIKKNFQKSGIRAFYNGFSLVFLRGLIVNGVVLSSFDFCRARFITNE